MATISEQITEQSAELLLKALGALSKISYETIDAGNEISKAVLIKFIEKARNSDANYDKKTNQMLDAFVDKAEKENETPHQIVISKDEAKLVEKWLKEQNVDYVLATPKEDAIDFEKGQVVLMFFEKDLSEVEIGVSLTSMQRGIINELPPKAFLFLHGLNNETATEKQNISVLDGFSAQEIEVFREVAKNMNLVYSVMYNAVDKETGEVYSENPDSYKILCSKADAEKLAAITQQVSWCMTGDSKSEIEEKVKERLTIRKEIERIIKRGIPEGYKQIKLPDGTTKNVANGKYIVDAYAPGNYIQLTANGFVYTKNDKENMIVSKDDPEFSQKLFDILDMFSDYVVFDTFEWEEKQLQTKKSRFEKVKEKLSVFTVNHSFEKENEEFRKAHRRKKEENKEELNVPEETAWVYYKYDTEQAFTATEIIELNYSNPSEPLERTVSSHYEDSQKHFEKYKYTDISYDEKEIDVIITNARQRSAVYEETEITEEKEIDSI